jgi:hypothetical protein
LSLKPEIVSIAIAKDKTGAARRGMVVPAAAISPAALYRQGSISDPDWHRA